MSGFSADWLALREPADAAARPGKLLEWLAPALQAHETLRILDLATGTGSNLRYLAPRLGASQHWTLADHDPRLLAAIPVQLEGWAREHELNVQTFAQDIRLDGAAFDCRIERWPIDLAQQIELLDLAGYQLVTTAALLDLVSGHWLKALISRCREAGVAVLFALSYDGRIEFSSAEPEDDRIVELVNLHQRTEKGFGPALGQEAATRARDLLGQAGYETRSLSSDWQLHPGQVLLQTELITGWATAAAEMAPHEEGLIRDWLHRRLRFVASGLSRVRVGHLDVAGQPISAPGQVR